MIYSVKVEVERFNLNPFFCLLKSGTTPSITCRHKKSFVSTPEQKRSELRCVIQFCRGFGGTFRSFVSDTVIHILSAFHLNKPFHFQDPPLILFDFSASINPSDKDIIKIHNPLVQSNRQLLRGDFSMKRKNIRKCLVLFLEL